MILRTKNRYKKKSIISFNFQYVIESREKIITTSINILCVPLSSWSESLRATANFQILPRPSEPVLILFQQFCQDSISKLHPSTEIMLLLFTPSSELIFRKTTNFLPDPFVTL